MILNLTFTFVSVSDIKAFCKIKLC